MKKIITIFTLCCIALSISSQLFAQSSKKDTVKVYDIYSEGKDLLTPEDRVYDMVEIAPEFPGGQDALWNFIQTNKTLKNDDKSKKDSILLLVKGIVERNGCISNAKILLSMNHKYDDEALKIVNSMPKWIPAKQDGKVIRAFITIPFRY